MNYKSKLFIWLLLWYYIRIKIIEQTSDNTEHNMTDKIIEKEVKQEEVVNDIGKTTNSAINVEEVKQDEFQRRS